MRWYRRAAAKDHIGAKVELAQHLVFGVGTDKNLEEGVALLTDAAARGYAPAQLRLGWLHIMGRGVKEDQARGFELFTKAAAQGEASAQVEVGEVLRRRSAGPEAQHEAVLMFLKAAQKLHFGGMRKLADHYLHGRGVAVNYPRAIAWLKICALSRELQDQARLALALASCPDAKFRNPAEAVEIAAQAVKRLGTDECPEGPAVLQAAAAAYASAAKFDKAEELETRAARVIKAMFLPAEQASESARRLEAYQNQEPYVEAAPESKAGAQTLPEDTVLEDFDSLALRMTSGY
ncbi:MAG: tetratricopeptide repeat protein [Prosthecobacter sp.]